MTARTAITLHLPPVRLAVFLLGVIACLFLAQIGVAVLQALGYDHAMGLVGLFGFEYEANAPTLFSSLLHILAAAACLANSAVTKRFRLVWMLGVALFLFMAIDEIYGIHEPVIFVLKGGVSETTAHLRNLIGVTFADIWIHLIGVGILVSLLLVPFARSLHTSTLAIVGSGFILFLLGAVVIDTRLGNMDRSDEWTWFLEILSWIEELSEMLGIVVVIFGLYRNLSLSGRAVSVTLGPED